MGANRDLVTGLARIRRWTTAGRLVGLLSVAMATLLVITLFVAVRFDSKRGFGIELSDATVILHISGTFRPLQSPGPRWNFAISPPSVRFIPSIQRQPLHRTVVVPWVPLVVCALLARVWISFRLARACEGLLCSACRYPLFNIPPRPDPARRVGVVLQCPECGSCIPAPSRLLRLHAAS